MWHLNVLKERLLEVRDGGVAIDVHGGGNFRATPVMCGETLIGVNVDCLPNEPFLPMDVFVATLSLLYLSPNHQAAKGSARAARLGDPGMELDTIEGHVAHLVFGTPHGKYALQRITPISRILEWAGVCVNGPGYLQLMP
jgi:hypothetical protein